MKKIAPFGAWKSPVSLDDLVTGSVSVGEVIPQPDSVWWAESRPSENGRVAIMRHHAGQTTEITSPVTNVRTLVHEYGGGAWWVEDEVCYFVDYADQRLRSISPEHTEALLLSPVPDQERSLRYTDMRLSHDRRWLIAVAESHRADLAEPENSLVAVATDGSLRCDTIEAGADFYAAPRVSPNGKQLAWIRWYHPHMPWDDTELVVADISISDSGITLKNHRVVAGGENEAIVQPEWSSDGVLHYLSDRTDHWQLYREAHSEPVMIVDGEIGYPPWVFGISRYAINDDGTISYARFSDGVDYLEKFDHYSAFHSIRSSGQKLAFAASSWFAESTVFHDGHIVHAPKDHGLARSFITEAEQISCTTADGSGINALFYPPRNPEFDGPEGEKPPLIVLAHGGPTSAARSQFSMARQFWTTRGFAVVDVNYRGSSGFGRAYRKKLEGQWGISDVEDCVSVARYLVDRGDVDAGKLIVRGGSAGGYTVLCGLAFHDVFTAGANMYGVADLEALASDTHKFESRYLDSLVGSYPEHKARYRERSPIHHLDGFTAPMIVLQGSEDLIVPPNQSRMIVEALRKRDVPVAYLEFEGEQHGFRQADTIRTALAAELMFYGQVFGFDPDTGLSPAEKEKIVELL